MPMSRLRRLALWGGAFALLLSPAPALAQSGQPPVGPPVTAPETNDLANPEGDAPPSRVGDVVLPPVPATVADPAPPGTRPVPAGAIVPGATTITPGTTTVTPGTALPRTGVAPRAVVPRRTGAAQRGTGVRALYAEGVVSRLMKRGQDLPEERIRFVLDTTEDWQTYVDRTIGGVPTGIEPPARTTRTPAQPPRATDRAADRLEDAAERLEDAAERLDDATSPGAVDPAPTTTPDAGDRADPGWRRTDSRCHRAGPRRGRADRRAV